MKNIVIFWKQGPLLAGLPFLPNCLNRQGYDPLVPVSLKPDIYLMR